MARKRKDAGRKPVSRDPMQVTPIRLPADMLRRAKLLADADRRPLSAYLRLLIERAVETAEHGA